MRGTLTVDAASVTVTDPLADLPLPEEDRTAMRTFPGVEERGEVTWTRVAPGKYAFHTWLPRRFGGVGATSHGLFGNGAWYPQPRIDGDALPVVDWEVRVRGPEGVVMALGDTVGGVEVRWEGQAERASLAVVPDGVVERLEGSKTFIVAKGRVRRVLRKELTAMIAELPSASVPAVIVEAPLRRRLARSGAKQVLVSDRAFRVFGAARRFHRVGLARELMPAFVPLPDPVHRAWVGASWAEDYSDDLAGAGAAELSSKVRWIPSIDLLLTSRTMPFYGEILEKRYSEDPLSDDLSEVYAPHYPGAAVVQLLDDVGGEGHHRAVAAVLLTGASTAEAIPVGEPGASLLPGWRQAVPDQDYVLSLGSPGFGPVAVRREAPADAPAEPVRIAIDGEETLWIAGPGPDAWSTATTGKGVVLDPGAHLKQQSRVGDRHPLGLQLTGGGWIDNINITDLRMTAALLTTLRRKGDLRNSVSGTLSTSENDLARARVGYRHRFGAPLDGRRRAFSAGGSLTAGWHHKWYADDVGTRYSLGAGGSVRWSTRVASTFPVRGSYASLGSSVGYAPEGAELWGGFGTGVGTVVSWHPRVAVDLRTRFGGSFGVGDTRKLSLGGVSGIRGLDPSEVARGTFRAIQSAQIRWAPIRNASVPVPLAWGTELQLGAGLEVGELWTDDGLEHGAGLVLGAYVLGDVFGLEPRGMGLTVGLPLVDADGLVEDGYRSPTVFLRWGPDL